ncbi:MAG: hypothetical protein ACE5JB_12855 [bacterium]
MLNQTSGLVKFILYVLLFPMFFQKAFITFVWGAGDQTGVMIGKRLFLLLPVLAIILGCWLSIACLLTVLIRQNRREFVTDLFITWLDLAKSIVAFWGGIFKFLFNLFIALLVLVKITILGIWSAIQDIIFMPFRLIRNFGRNVVSSPVPWIAVFLTLFWCLIEAVIFTYVTTPLVVDTFSNITGEQFAENFIRIPLFIFLLFVVLGSYAVLSTFVDSFKKKSISSILGIGMIEIVVLFVEVVFLYREFVDSLVPWFAQYSENFELGIFWTLAISCFIWFGIRSLSWFLFAAHGTPTILAVIQGKGMALSRGNALPEKRSTYISSDFMNKIKEETTWVQTKGDELLASFILPPLQVVAAAINFCSLLISNNHLFELPFKNIEAITITNSSPKIVIDENARNNESFSEASKNIGDFQNV